MEKQQHLLAFKKQPLGLEEAARFLQPRHHGATGAPGWLLPATPPRRHWHSSKQAVVGHATTAQPTPLQSVGVGKHHDNASKEGDDAPKASPSSCRQIRHGFRRCSPTSSTTKQGVLKARHPCPPPLDYTCMHNTGWSDSGESNGGSGGVHQRSHQEGNDIHGRQLRWEKHPRGINVPKLAPATPTANTSPAPTPPATSANREVRQSPPHATHSHHGARGEP